MQRAFSLLTLGELERELLLELAMVVLINGGMNLYETSRRQIFTGTITERVSHVIDNGLEGSLTAFLIKFVRVLESKS